MRALSFSKECSSLGLQTTLPDTGERCNKNPEQHKRIFRSKEAQSTQKARRQLPPLEQKAEEEEEEEMFRSMILQGDTRRARERRESCPARARSASSRARRNAPRRADSRAQIRAGRRAQRRLTPIPRL